VKEKEKGTSGSLVGPDLDWIFGGPGVEGPVFNTKVQEFPRIFRTEV
jgi:hypothetical protein